MTNIRVLTTKDTQTAGTERGNVAIIVLVVLVIVAVGALAFLSGKLTDDGQDAGTPPSAEMAKDDATAPATDASAANETATAAGEEIVVDPGNPVVANVNGEEITRLEVFNFIQTLPPNIRQQPVQQLFPLALNQVVTAKIIEDKTEGVKLDNDAEVKAQLAAAKENIVRSVYIQKQVEKKVTEDRLKAAYDTYKSTFPEVQEAKASHILVDDEKLAKDLTKQLEEGADFAELAKANSKDGTASNGGQLGYFTEAEVVPEFAKAAFALEAGAVTGKPVKSEFGYHVIKLEEKRQRPAAEYEQIKPYLEGELRRAALDEVVSEWRKSAKVETFDINGKSVVAAEPAAGE